MFRIPMRRGSIVRAPSKDYKSRLMLLDTPIPWWKGRERPASELFKSHLNKEEYWRQRARLPW